MTRTQLENLVKEVMCDKDIHHNISFRTPDDVGFFKDAVRHVILALHHAGKLK